MVQSEADQFVTTSQLPFSPHAKRSRWRRVAINGRSALARRIRQQADLYRQLLGYPADAMTERRIAEAAELAIAVENWRARLLAGEDVEEAVTRLTNIRARAEAKLGLAERNAEPPRKTHADVIAAILAGRPAPGEPQDTLNGAPGTRTALEQEPAPAMGATRMSSSTTGRMAHKRKGAGLSWKWPGLAASTASEFRIIAQISETLTGIIAGAPSGSRLQ
jgi:hypothetical protein